uniref:Uncharacterized protein n=1 Tax=Eutreptiella gymnastica TaxID=73025 RepID=A0A7S1J5C2_9EUGL
MNAAMFLLVLFSVLLVASGQECKCEVEYYVGSSSCSSIFSPDTDMTTTIGECKTIASAQSSLFPSGGAYYKVTSCTNEFVGAGFSDSNCSTQVGSNVSFTADGSCINLASLSFLDSSINLGSVKFTCGSSGVVGIAPVWYLVAMCLGVMGLLNRD